MRTLALLIPLLCLSACTDMQESEGALSAPVSDADAEITFTLNIGGTADTRTATIEPRRLFSSDNWQHATDVRVYTFYSTSQNGDYIACSSIDSNTGKPAPYITVPQFAEKGLTTWTDENKYETYELVVRGRVATQYYYKFLAVGRDDTTPEDESHRTWDIDIPSGTRYELAAARLRGDSLNATELFAGQNDTAMYIAPFTNIYRRDIYMKRAVAGLLMYVENIPVAVFGDTVKAVGIAFRDVYRQDVILPGRTFGGRERQAAAGQPILISDTIPAIGLKGVGTQQLEERDADGNLVRKFAPSYTFNGTWPYSPETHPASHPNALPICGTFITPQPANKFTTQQGSTPLVLVFYNKHNEPIHAFDLIIDQPQYHAYPLEANHIYCIGEHRLEGDYKDKPVDLSEHFPENEPYLSSVIIVYGHWQTDIDIPL